MFGNGIYFADTPLKSWQYSKSKYFGLPAAHFFWMVLLLPLSLLCCSPLLVRRLLVDGPSLMLLSRVELGATKVKLKADTSETGHGPKSDQIYHSITALPRECGGALRVPEYIIYNPRQAQVEYILEFKEVARVSNA